MLRTACLAVAAAGERSAWIDGGTTIAGAFWTDGPYLVRPASHLDAIRAAGELLRSGGFSLLVLAGCDPQGVETVRLTRAAREGGTALVAIGTATSMASVRLSSRLVRWQWRRTPFGEPADARQATVRVQSRAAGWNAHVEFPLPVLPHELRLSLEPALVDRRGRPR